MTPLEQLARALDACRESGIRVKVEVFPDVGAGDRQTSTERVRAFRKRQKGPNETLWNANETLPPSDSPSRNEVEDLDKKAEKEPDTRKDLAVTARARGELEREMKRHETRFIKTRAKSFRRVPPDWLPTDQHRSLALQLIVDVELEAQKFRDHEFRYPKSDADAAFRTWLRNAATFHPRGGATSEQSRILARAANIIQTGGDPNFPTNGKARHR